MEGTICSISFVPSSLLLHCFIILLTVDDLISADLWLEHVNTTLENSLTHTKAQLSLADSRPVMVGLNNITLVCRRLLPLYNCTVHNKIQISCYFDRIKIFHFI